MLFARSDWVLMVHRIRKVRKRGNGKQQTNSDFEKQMIAQTPLGRLGQPQDIAPVAAFLASSDSGWITGEILHVAGGLG